MTSRSLSEKQENPPDESEEASEANATPSSDPDDEDVMDTMKLTRDISPQPAFDINGDPIVPSQYEKLLYGATVEVHFALTSWVFLGKDAKAMNIPVIREMLVASPPRPPIASPMKKKI
ncbi:hypothetical protein JB92DRAFT_3096682 [Gautieria morchelliformis]|nr:hypothetical protein JB92DRAFT_3096682 [Gautieria morchelliformis]